MGVIVVVEQVRVWRAACEQANARSEQKAAEFERSLKVERRRSKQLEWELRRKEKALAEAAALLILAKKYRAFPALVKNARELPGALAPLLRDRDFVLMAGAGDIGVVAQEVGTRGHLKEGKA